MTPLDNGVCHRLVAYNENPVAALAIQIIAEQEKSLPDLTHVTVFINNPNKISELRRQLLVHATASGYNGLLGPTICSLRDYVIEHSSLTKTIIGDRARELMLYKALAQRQELFGTVSTWFLVDNLLALFDELSANHTPLPKDSKHFVETLATAYGLQHSVNPEQAALSPLNRETNIVHTLWHAYQEQLDAYDYTDNATAHRKGLQQLINAPSLSVFYVAGYHRLLPAELAFLQRLDANKQVGIFLHGQQSTCTDETDPNQLPLSQLQSDIAIHPLLSAFSFEQTAGVRSTGTHSAYSDFLNNTYTPLASTESLQRIGIKQRAQSFSQKHPQSPAKHRLRLCNNTSAEHEAQAIALQLVHWRKQGKQQLAIITEDRRLARRVRALLERFGLTVNDYTGWALSTTSAAAVIECWLSLIEQDFAYQPLLDLLKSSFVLPDWDRDKLSKATYRFEQDIIRRENVQANLARYRSSIRSRQKRLQWQNNDVSELLDAIEYAAQPIIRFTKTKSLSKQDSSQNYLLSDLLSAVELSMQRIGLISTLQNDEAGHDIIEQLQTLQSIAEAQTETLPWQAFRQWLARSFEKSYFQLQRTEGGIALLPASQSNLEQFDALIIAAADASHLPTRTPVSPLFNQSVRKELGLRTQTDELQTTFYHFRRLLECAPDILATYTTDNNGQPQTLAPWLQLINAFHQMAYGQDLHDLTLATAASDLTLSNFNDTLLPTKLLRPAPRVSPTLLPNIYSASSYQQLIDCPYRFYAAQCLQLSAPEQIREALQKSDYGELVHRCLQAFHSEVKGLPQPFSPALTKDSRQAGIDHLNDIAKQVFATDLEDNALHRVWLERWRNGIPTYIDWQIKHAESWQFYGGECRTELAPTTDQYGLKGRIDRVDTSNNSDAVIDYKTGTTAKKSEVMTGESVQLPFYAMLWSRPVSQCKYLELGDKVKETIIEGDDLANITQDNQQRLNTLHQQLHQGATLPAWGDEGVCQYCEFQGVCRKQSWQSEPEQ